MYSIKSMKCTDQSRLNIIYSLCIEYVIYIEALIRERVFFFDRKRILYYLDYLK